jgi:hypothetical protein
MSGAWSHRIVKDENGKLHFAYVRFRPFEDNISGIIAPLSINNVGDTVDELRKLAQQLLDACDEGIIGPDGHDPDADAEDEDEDEANQH